MKLIIDFGNTFTKLAVFKQEAIIEQYQFIHLKITDLITISEKYPDISSVMISSVIDYPVEIKLHLKSRYSFFELDSNTPIPIINRYKSPETLGKDRIAAVVAANNLFPNENVLVIDAGTCITFDFLNDKKEYLGGAITPGLKIRFKALHEFTNNLPLVEVKKVEYLMNQLILII